MKRARFIFIILLVLAFSTAGGWAQSLTPSNVAPPVQTKWITTSASANPMVTPEKHIINPDRVGGCDASCPPDGILEGEPPCSDEYVDAYNGGCNSIVPVFSYVADGDVICGESGTYLFTGASYRDTDWYEIGVGLPGTLSMTCDANFPVAMFIIDALSGDCIEYTILGSTTGAECSATYLEAPVTAGGNYWLFVGPSVFTGVPCGSEYTLTVGFE